MVDLNAFALYRAQAVADWGDQTVAFVDIGARTTNVLVASRGVPRLVRILPSGGNDVTDAVASAMKVTTQEAEQSKRQIGIGFAVDPSLKPGAEALATTCRALVDAIRNTFVFYSQNNAGGPIQHVALTGRRIASSRARAVPRERRAPAGELRRRPVPREGLARRSRRVRWTGANPFLP